MNLYWIYDLPNWLFELLTILLFVAFSLSGLLATRRMIRRVPPLSDISGYFPMQKVEKIKFKISSAVVAPVNASRLRSAE